MSPLLGWLANHPSRTNMIAAVLNLIIAAIIYWFKPASFEKRPFTKRVFQMWIGQWFAFVVIFIVLNIISTVSPNSEGDTWRLIVLLCSVEVQTIFALACGWLMIQGNQDLTQRVLSILGILLLCLWLWDIAAGSLLVGNQVGNPGSRELWIFPSRILAMFAFLLVSVALFLRNKLTAVPFLVITIAYATVQLPIYHGTFVSLGDVSNWFTALAVGKLLIALTFYPAFFSARTSARITLRSLVAHRPALSAYLVQAPLVRKLVHAAFWVAMVAIEEIIRTSVTRAIGYK